MSGRKILYISSVPVTKLFSGATFMYRLFEDHEDDISIYQNEKIATHNQLAKGKYYYHRNYLQRLNYTRIRYWYDFTNVFRNHFFVPQQIKKIIKAEQPKVIVTVMNGFMWVLAYKVARQFKLPLVVIIHDDINSYFTVNTFLSRFLKKMFVAVLKYASLSFVISELMKKKYLEKFNVLTNVLYPLQEKEISNSDSAIKTNHENLTFAFAGSLDPSYAKMISEFAEQLRKVGGNINIYSNRMLPALESLPNIIYKGYRDADVLMDELASSSDVLFIPFPFYDAEVGYDIAFPSKIADYTCLPKPLFIWAPESCALSGWFHSLVNKPGVIVNSKDADKISNALLQLKDSNVRKIYGENSVLAGNEFFNNEKQKRIFYSGIDKLLNS